MIHYTYLDDSGKLVEAEEIIKGHAHYDQAMTAREKLIDQLSLYNEGIADKFLLGEEISEDEILKVLKIAIKDHNAVALH